MIKKHTPVWIHIIRFSRPLFWIYLAGPYIIGYTIFANGPRDVLRFEFFYTLFFFLIPANIILYGINDLYDQDTDAFNRKKDRAELRFNSSHTKMYVFSILASLILSIPLWIYLPLFAKVLFSMFLILSIFYSAKPFRLKAKPFVDSLSNILYAFPGFIAVYQLTSGSIPVSLVFAIICWTTAMHLFSAIPDIEADKKAHLRTTATKIGKGFSLLICSILWLVCGLLGLSYHFSLAFLLLYALIPLYLLVKPRAEIEDIYWKLPFVNGVSGFLLYLLALML